MNTMYYKHAHTHADLYWKFTTQIPVQQYKQEGMSEQREAFEMFINLVFSTCSFLQTSSSIFRCLVSLPRSGKMISPVTALAVLWHKGEHPSAV